MGKPPGLPLEASALTHAHRRGRLHVRSPLLRLQRDDRLVALMRRGNDAAFEVLFDRYRPRLLAFCRQMLRSTEDAEDVLQEVFVAAHRAILADERTIAVRPWLYKIARNRSLNHLRRPVPDGQDTMDDRPFEHGTTTLEHVQKREDFRHLIEDVGELPETQRTALLLRELEALSYEEIGETMDTTVPSVKSLLVRARMSLAEATEARLLTCNEVRIELAESAEGICRISGPVRRHVRGCEECKQFRTQLKVDAKALAAIFPGPLLALKGLVLGKLSGAGAASGGSATGGSAGAFGSAGAMGSAAGSSAGGFGGAIGGVIASKATAGVVTAALLTAGAVEMKRVSHHTPPPADPKAGLVSTPPPDARTAAMDEGLPPDSTATPAPAAAQSAHTAPPVTTGKPTDPSPPADSSGSAAPPPGDGGWSTSPDSSGGTPPGGGSATGSGDPAGPPTDPADPATPSPSGAGTTPDSSTAGSGDIAPVSSAH